jgi:hypothetical protein
VKTIIAGMRDFTNYTEVARAIKLSGFAISEVVSGLAPGVDHSGEIWAADNEIPVMGFKADWNAHGKAAGPMRNRQMAQYAEALVAVWDGKSRGTKNMIDEANKRGLRIYIHRV